MIHTAILHLDGKDYPILTCRYGFDIDVDSKNRPRSSIYGGSIIITLVSPQDDDSLFELFFTPTPLNVPGYILLTDGEQTLRKIAWEEAYIYNMGEEMNLSPRPVLLTLSITPLRLDFNNSLRIDRRYSQSYNGVWRKHVPEEKAVAKQPVVEEEPPPPPECTAYLRRRSDYDGSFGYDWLRTGDTDEPGCGWYKDSMHSVKDYDRFVEEYRYFTQKWKQQYEEHRPTATYLVPWATLMPGCKATFRVKLSVNKPSGELKLRLIGSHGDMLTLSYDTINADKEGNYYVQDLTVQCNGTFSSTITLEICDSRMEPVGKLAFLPNHKVRYMDVAVVTVTTRPFGSEARRYKRSPDLEELEGVRKLLQQAYIVPVFHFYELDTTEVAEVRREGERYTVYFQDHNDKTSTLRIAKEHEREYKKASLLEILFKSNSDKRIKANSELGLKYFPNLHKFLNQMLYKQEGKENLEGMFKFYFIHEDPAGATAGTGRGHAGLEEKAAIMFKEGYSKETITHELLHCLSLPHTFIDSDKEDRNQKHLFKKFSTDNLMDYHNENESHDKRKSLWYWQLKQIWKFLE